MHLYAGKDRNAWRQAGDPRSALNIPFALPAAFHGRPHTHVGSLIPWTIRAEGRVPTRLTKKDESASQDAHRYV